MKERKRGRLGPKYTTHEEDKALVQEAIDGKQSAYNTLVQKYKPILFIAAKRRLSYYSDDDLEDIVMSVLGNSFVKIKQYDPTRAKFFWWILACLHNHISSLYRRDKLVNKEKTVNLKDAGNFAVNNEFDFTEDYDKEQVSKLVRLLIDKLPEDHSKAITLRYFKNYTNEQIAEELGCKPNDVWYKLKKAKETLKKLSKNGKLF
jgi:RNA polymerase sigma-70 factor (ECF subfamily)